MINPLRPLRLCGLFFFLLITAQLFSQEITQSLNSNWQFTEANKNEWLSATVPGTIHTDLLAHGKIPDPYPGTNESKVQWVETKTWEYKTTFDADDALWKSKHKDLLFEGLDTYAFVFLNDSLILTAENMFLRYVIDVQKQLKKKGNVLRIVFHPASELIEKNKALSSIKNLPGGDRVFIRKAQYQFGWDWGPRLVTSGIWKPVQLTGWDEFKLLARLRTDKVQNDTAYLIMPYSIMAATEKSQEVRITFSDATKTYADYKITTAGTYSPQPDKLIKIPHPRLWWCNGMGKQEMYHFKITVTNGKSNSAIEINYGIRTTRLDTTADESGNEFTFYLNNEPIFIKGANWIPCDNFLPRVTSEKYYSLLKSAQQSNMNMLRVWGGGAYEDDKFYNDCDSLGIMVWQDFMYAGGIYPQNEKSRGDAADETSMLFYKLSKHPCVTIWCGNNEISEAWNNWGWQKEMKISAADSAAMWKYETYLFNDLIKNIITARDSHAIYIPSSPATGWGHPEAYKSGDVHYWGVWWGMEPFSAYETHVGRLVSEYGFQAMPPLSSFRLFDADQNISLADSTVRSHQKYPTGFETINTYMQRDYPVPDKIEDYIYVSQVMQRDGISKAIEAHRRAMPYCMGTLFWQYNDCWPVTSWSTVDYYGQKKLLQYGLKDLYAPLLISVLERNDSVLIYLVNDDTVSHKGLLAFQCMNFYGENVRTSFTPTTVYVGRSTMVLGFEKKMFFDTLKPTNGVLHLIFNYENGKNITANHYFVNTKSLALPKDPGLVSDIVPAVNKPGTYAVTLRTVSLAKNVYLSLDDASAKFSDNGFDMLPGETKDVVITSTLSLDQLKAKLKIQTMNSLR